jgi:hypothetical protein
VDTGELESARAGAAKKRERAKKAACFNIKVRRVAPKMKSQRAVFCDNLAQITLPKSPRIDVESKANETNFVTYVVGDQTLEKE